MNSQIIEWKVLVEKSHEALFSYSASPSIIKMVSKEFRSISNFFYKMVILVHPPHVVAAMWRQCRLQKKGLDVQRWEGHLSSDRGDNVPCIYVMPHLLIQMLLFTMQPG